jgi:hypothetical protein
VRPEPCLPQRLPTECSPIPELQISVVIAGIPTGNADTQRFRRPAWWSAAVFAVPGFDAFADAEDCDAEFDDGVGTTEGSVLTL